MSLRWLLRERPNPERTARLLPMEICFHILSFLPPDTKLYPLLFIDSGFRAEIERQLYSNISLGRDEIQPGKDQDRPVQRRIKLFKILARTPRLSHKVHSLTVPPFIFNVRTGREWGDWEKRASLHTLYWHLLNLAVRAMPNLKEFTLGSLCSHAKDRLPVQRFSAIFEECTFHLRKLHITGVASHNIEVPENCDVFRELEELTIPHEPYGGFNIPIAAPRLTILEVLAWTIPRLYIPSRQIKALSFQVTWPSADDLDNLVVRSHPELHSLKLGLPSGPNDWSIWMQRFMSSFTGLTFLHLDVSWTTTIDRIRGAIAQLCVLVQLRKVVFRHVYYRWDHNTWDGMTLEGVQSMDVAQLFFAAIPQLMVAHVDLREWGRDEIGIGKYAIRKPDPEEWKDKRWWN